jgi:hypothetical protein
MKRTLALLFLIFALFACTETNVQKFGPVYHMDGTFKADLEVQTVNIEEDGNQGNTWVESYPDSYLIVDQMGPAIVFPNNTVGLAEEDAIYFSSDRLYDIYLQEQFFIQFYIDGHATREEAEIVYTARWFNIETNSPLHNGQVELHFTWRNIHRVSN